MNNSSDNSISNGPTKNNKLDLLKAKLLERFSNNKTNIIDLASLNVPSISYPSNIQPLDIQPLNIQPLDIQPLNIQPLDIQPLDIQPLDIQPLNIQSLDVQPVEIQSENLKSMIIYNSPSLNTNTFYRPFLLNKNLLNNINNNRGPTGPTGSINYGLLTNLSFSSESHNKKQITYDIPTTISEKDITLSLDGVINSGSQIYTFGQHIPNKFISVFDTPITLNTTSYYIASSNDGLIWSPIGSNINFPLQNVKWNGSMYVAVGNGICYSYDGIKWASGSGYIIGDNLYNIEYGESMWIATTYPNETASPYPFNGNSNNKYYYSYDGINWNTHNISSLTNIYGIIWVNDMWLIWGINYAVNYVSSSVQNIGSTVYTWTTNTTINSLILSSLDGLNWTQQYTYTNINRNNTNTQTVSFGIPPNPDPNFPVANNLTCMIHNLTWNGQIYVYAANNTNNASIYYSSILSSWTQINIMIFFKSCTSLIWTGKFFIASGSGNTGNLSTYYSYDAIYWTSVNNVGVLYFNCITWNESCFIGFGPKIGSGPYIAYSKDGINWYNSNNITSSLTSSLISSGAKGVTNNMKRQNIIKFPKKMVIACGSSGIFLMKDGNPNTWSNIATISGITKISKMVWTGSRSRQMWVGICIAPTFNIIYSYDAINWKTSNIGGGAGNVVFTPNCIKWSESQSMFVVGINKINGYSNLWYSYDAITWTPSNTNSIIGNCTSIEWNGTLWVSTFSSYSLSCAIYYSYDGINWNPTDVASTIKNTYCIKWNGNMWLVGGNYLLGGVNVYTMSYSYNRSHTNWATYTFIYLNGAYDIEWNGSNMWLAVGNVRSGISAACSYDGLIWSAISLRNYNLSSICWSGYEWLIIGPSETPGHKTIISSYDGINFNYNDIPNDVSTITNNNCEGAVTIYNQYVYVGKGIFSIANSNDGINWNGINNVFINGRAVAFNGNIWVAVGDGVYSIAYSYDTIEWHGVSTNLLIGITVVWNGTLWIAAGSYNTNDPNGSNFYYSYDGVNWNKCSGSKYSDTCNKVAWNGSYWIAIGTNSQSGPFLNPNPILTSTNGIVWTSTNSSNLLFLYALIWSGTRWITTGRNMETYDCYILISTNGIDWYDSSIDIVSIINDFAFNGSRLIAACQSPTSIYYSDDNGDTFTNASSGNNVFNKAACAIWDGTKFIVGGIPNIQGNSSIQYSYDGSTWYQSASSSSMNTNCLGIATLPPIRQFNASNKLILNKYGINKSQTLDIVPSSYYNNGFNNMNLSIKSNKL